MIYATHDYTTKQFDTQEEAMEYIKQKMDRQNISYQPVYDHTEGNVRVIVYQYYTLYMETFIIHKQFDLRR